MDRDSFWFYNAVIRSVAKQANIPIAEAAQMVKRSFLKRMIFKSPSIVKEPVDRWAAEIIYLKSEKNSVNFS